MAGGRPTRYKPEYVEQAEKLCKMGATDQQLADFFKVSIKTIELWKRTHKEFIEALKRGKELADATVAESLYHRAIGYSHEADELKVVSVGNNGGSVVETHRVTKIYPPETLACIFWLKNRQPKLWRDKQEVEAKTVNSTVVHDGGSLTPDEMVRFKAQFDDDY